MNKHTTIFIILLLSISFISSAQDKPLLSKAIKEAIDSKGTAAARSYFAEIYKSKKDIYRVDLGELSKESNAYIQAGKIEEAGALMEIASPFMNDALMNQMASSPNQQMRQLAEMQKNAKDKRENENKVKKPSEEERIVEFKGESRNDLLRFTGLYGDPDKKDKNRRLWVAVSWDGYLVAGALWGDASPWWMKSESDKVFSYKDSFTELRLEFEMDGSGKALQMKHDLLYMKNPLERIGPLPEDWDPCIERPKR